MVTKKQKSLTFQLLCEILKESMPQPMPEPVTARVFKTYHCLKCGYEWQGRLDTKPVRCANTECKRPNWDKPRQEKCGCGRRGIRGVFDTCSLCRREAVRRVDTNAAEDGVGTEPKKIISGKNNLVLVSLEEV